MINVVCIYTCLKDENKLNVFKNTSLYKKLIDSPHIVLEVYSNSDKNKQIGNKLFLRGNDSYNELSIKTYEMISYCVKNYKFDNIIKIDSSLCYDETLETEKWRKNFTPNVIQKFVEKPNFNDYDGILYTTLTQNTFKQWALRKKLKVNCVKSLIGKDTFNSYFVGKCYSVSYIFANFIANKCKNRAYLFKSNYGGIEDLFIGKSYYNFRIFQ